MYVTAERYTEDGKFIKRIRIDNVDLSNKNTQINIPDSVEVIGAYAFAGCKGLKEVKLPSGIKRIEYGAFSDMNISEIVVPKSVDYIGNEAFEGIENVVKR